MKNGPYIAYDRLNKAPKTTFSYVCSTETVNFNLKFPVDGMQQCIYKLLSCDRTETG